MNVRQEMWLLTALLMMLNLVLASGAIGLFGRMSPAIERIIEENADSMSVAGELMGVFALPGDLPLEQRERIGALLATLQRNVTEAAEAPLIEEIRGHLDAAREGQPEARAAVIRALAELQRVNHAAMERAELEARRLGAAGAWSAAIIGGFAFLAGLLALRRVRTQLIEPLEEIDGALRAVLAGDRFRRCRSSGTPVEIESLARGINAVLDGRVATHTFAASAAPVMGTGPEQRELPPPAVERHEA